MRKGFGVTCLLVGCLVLGYGARDAKGQHCMSNPPGDVNGNGETNLVDTQCIILHSFGGEMFCGDAGDADLDCDGAVNTVDVMTSITLALGAPLDEQIDADQDGQHNDCDPDRDGDGFNNDRDPCPDDPSIAWECLPSCSIGVVYLSGGKSFHYYNLGDEQYTTAPTYMNLVTNQVMGWCQGEQGDRRWVPAPGLSPLERAAGLFRIERAGFYLNGASFSGGMSVPVAGVASVNVPWVPLVCPEDQVSCDYNPPFGGPLQASECDDGDPCTFDSCVWGEFCGWYTPIVTPLEGCDEE